MAKYAKHQIVVKLYCNEKTGDIISITVNGRKMPVTRMSCHIVNEWLYMPSVRTSLPLFGKDGTYNYSFWFDV